MRHFSSYGPVDEDEHFCVPRRELVAQCAAQLVGDPARAGHYFTIWAPRQTGKTWLMRRAMLEVRRLHGDRFLVAETSMQEAVRTDDEPDTALLKSLPRLLQAALGRKVAPPADWEEWLTWFQKDGGLFDRPVILLIDEFDNLPRHMIDRLVALFCGMYLARDRYLLHGLALVGVSAVLGVDSQSGSEPLLWLTAP